MGFGVQFFYYLKRNLPKHDYSVEFQYTVIEALAFSGMSSSE